MVRGSGRPTSRPSGLIRSVCTDPGVLQEQAVPGAPADPEADGAFPPAGEGAGPAGLPGFVGVRAHDVDGGGRVTGPMGGQPWRNPRPRSGGGGIRPNPPSGRVTGTATGPSMVGHGAGLG